MAFGMRVTAAERGLELDVWQRPSTGRTFQEAPVPWASRPHSFAGPASPVVTPLEFEWPVRLTTTSDVAHKTAKGRAPAVLLIQAGPQGMGRHPRRWRDPRAEARPPV